MTSTMTAPIPTETALNATVTATKSAFADPNFTTGTQAQIDRTLVQAERFLSGLTVDPANTDMVQAQSRATARIAELRGTSAGTTVEVPTAMLTGQVVLTSVKDFVDLLAKAGGKPEPAMLRFKIPTGSFAEAAILKEVLLSTPGGTFTELLDRLVAKKGELGIDNKDVGKLNKLKNDRKASTAHEYAPLNRAGGEAHTEKIRSDNPVLYDKDDGLVTRLPVLVNQGQKVVANLKFSDACDANAIRKSVEELVKAVREKIGEDRAGIDAMEKNFEIWVHRGDGATPGTTKIERITGWHLSTSYNSAIAARVFDELADDLIKLRGFAEGIASAGWGTTYTSAAPDQALRERQAAALARERDSMLALVAAQEDFTLRLDATK